jgi:outer membrane protein OmpA-like peptidoglycan-associated protein
MSLLPGCMLNAQVPGKWLVDSLPAGVWHSPVVSPDGGLLFLVNQGNPRNMGTANANDIWMLQRQEDGSWGGAMHLGATVNSRLTDGIAAAGPAGSWLLLFSPEKGLAPRIAQRAGRAWQLTDSIHIAEVSDWAQVRYCFLDASKSVFLFSADWEGGFGGQDIYKSVRTADGHWTKPENLGAGINSAQNDIAPLLAADEETLYYESYADGRRMLRMSRKNIRTNQWERSSEVKVFLPSSSPQGPRLALFPDGKNLVMVETDSLGNTRPRWQALPDNAAAKPMQVLRGSCQMPVFSDNTDVEVYMRELKTGHVKPLYIDPLGNFCALLPVAAIVSVEGRKPGYFSAPVLLNAEKEVVDPVINWLQLGSLSTDYYQREDTIKLRQERLQEVGRQMAVLRERYEIKLPQLAYRVREMSAHEWEDNEIGSYKEVYDAIVGRQMSKDSFTRFVHLLEEDRIVRGLIDSFLNDLRRSRSQQLYSNMDESDWDSIAASVFRDLTGRLESSEVALMKLSEKEREEAEKIIKNLSVPLDLLPDQGYQNMKELTAEAVELYIHEKMYTQLGEELHDYAQIQSVKDEKLSDWAESREDVRLLEDVEDVSQPLSAVQQVTLTFRRMYEGARFVIDDFYFHDNGTDLTDKGLMIVAYLQWLLQTHPGMGIQVSCHTHRSMHHSKAIDQTMQRARSIQTSLIDMGIDYRRVIPKGYGKSLPIAAADSLSTNQRTEVLITVMRR